MTDTIEPMLAHTPSSNARVADLERKLAEAQSTLAGITEVIHRYLNPRTELVVDGLNAYGEVHPFTGKAGGDLLHFLNLKEDFDLNSRISRAHRLGQTEVEERLKAGRNRISVLKMDVMGHSAPQAVEAAIMYHAAMSVIASQLDQYGHVMPSVFDALNDLGTQGKRNARMITASFGDITSSLEKNKAVVKWISSGEGAPLIYRHEKREFDQEWAAKFEGTFPIGVAPTRRGKTRNAKQNTKPNHVINKTTLLPGDILFLASDGTLEHEYESRKRYFPKEAVDVVRGAYTNAIRSTNPARSVVEVLMSDMISRGAQKDDMTLGAIYYKGKN